MFHLDAGVHFDEVVVSVLVHQELHGTGVDIAHFPGNLDCVIIELLALFRGNTKGRGELHHLLVPALHRTVTLKEMYHIAVLVSEDLHFDVLGLLQELFHKDVVIAEGLAGLVPYQLKVPGDLPGIVGPAHASSAAAGCRLEDHRITGLLRNAHGLLHTGHRLFTAGNDRYAAPACHFLGVELIAHLIENLTGRPDEDDARFLTGPGEVGILGQEAIAGVDGIHILALCQCDDLLNAQIGAERAAVLADEIGFVRLGAEERELVLLGIDGYCAHTGVKTGTEDADRDLTAVCHQYLADLFLHSISPLA